MKNWNYELASPVIWTSFDYGVVEAETKEEALVLAKRQLIDDFAAVNKVLEANESTKGLSVHFSMDEIKITEA